MAEPPRRRVRFEQPAVQEAQVAQMNVDQQVAVARLQTEMAHVREAVVELKELIGELRTEIGQANKAITEARGGWKTLMAIGGAFGGVAGGVISLVAWVKGAK